MSYCSQCAKLLRENEVMKEMLDIVEQDGGDTLDLRKEAIANLKADKRQPKLAEGSTKS